MDVDVRVWYTLDSQPQRMLAPLGRHSTIDVIESTNKKSGATGPRFAKITLKTCLSAICIASPELILDRSRDYTLYVVDPEQTYKASVRGSKGGHQNGGQHHHHQQQQQQAAQQGSSTSSSSSSNTRTRQVSAQSSIVVGKGFLQWILEEQGDGETVVVGRITDDEDEEAGHDSVPYLDVEIRLKETKAQSREQYFAMLRQFGGGGSASTSNSSSKHPPSLASVPTQRKSAHPPPAKKARPSAPTHRSSSPLQVSSPINATAAGAPGQQSQALQILQLLQVLQARQATTTQQPPAMHPPNTDALLSQALEALNGGGGGAGNAHATISSAATHLAKPASLPSIPSTSSVTTTNTAMSPPATTTMLQCYNCGHQDTNKATWRLVTLTQNQKVQYPRAFECDPNAANQDDNSPPLDAQGFAIANGRTSWRACNRCGLFWSKWKTNRPETLEKKRGIKRKAAKSASAAASSPPPPPVANNDGDDEAEDDERDEIQDSSPPRVGVGVPASLHPTLQPPQHLPKKKKRIRKSTAMELVQDKNGMWRSRRSVQENPEGRRPGRPAGCKTGEGQGKSRDHKKRAAAAAAARSASGDGGVAASDPVDAGSSSSSEDVEGKGSSIMHHGVAQTSPVRRSYPWEGSAQKSASTHNNKSSALPYGNAFHSTPGFSPSRKRYGAPFHILNSSPSTALDALLSEGADFNFDFSHPSAAATLFGGSPHLGSPLRRSPRKNPNGTRGEQRNPYATGAGSPLGGKGKKKGTADGSPSAAVAGAASPMLDMDLFTAFTNFKSPNATLQPPADQLASKNSLIASSSPSRTGDDDDDDDDDTRRRNPLDSGVLTSLTSPGSPSPSRNRFEAKLVRGALRGSSAAASGQTSSAVGGASSASATPTRARLDQNDDDDEEDDDDGPDSPTTARQERLGSQRCPASPSLGQKRKRDAAAGGSPTPRQQDSHVLTKGPSLSPATSLRGKVSPVKSSLLPASLRASLSPAQKRAFAALSPQQQQQLVRRKPLPATVEDAPSSSPEGQYEDDEDDDESSFSPYDHGTVESFLDMLEDPYGLLAANGIGLGGASGSNSVAAPSAAAADNNNNNGVAATGSVSIDHFAGGVQLHDRLQFGSHLQAFNEEGSKGIAAYALPGLNSGEPTQQQQQQQQPIDHPSSTGASGEANKENDGRGTSQTTPKKSRANANASPSTPGKTRTSPRFNKQQKQSTNPPSTPGRTSLNDSPLKSLSLLRTPPRAANALALANAVARSPALQRMLNSNNNNTSSPNCSTLDFSTLFGSGGVPPGTFSPFVMPTGTGTPLSPSLSRLLNTTQDVVDIAQQSDLNTTTTNSLPPEAFAELQAMFQDPNFAAFFDDVSHRGQLQDQELHGDGAGANDVAERKGKVVV